MHVGRGPEFAQLETALCAVLGESSSGVCALPGLAVIAHAAAQHSRAAVQHRHGCTTQEESKLRE